MEKNSQFNEFMSTFGINQMVKALKLQQDKEMLELERKRNEIINTKLELENDSEYFNRVSYLIQR